MNIRGLLISALVIGGAILGGQGCSANANADADRICTPGANVFCRCADRSEGTKLCKGGTEFSACSTGDDGECKGGEITDPDTGKPVDKNGKPIDEENGNNGPQPTSVESCPGKSTSLTPGANLVIEGDTTGARDDGKGKPGACAVGAGGPDHVYHLVPTGSGTLNIKVQALGTYNPTIYLRTTCDDEATQVACGETTGAAGLEQINTNVVTGRDYYLFVDGASGTAGKYTVTAKLTTASFCGDGKVDANEACDDGNKTEGDGCSNDCRKVNGDPTTGGSCPGHPVHVWSGQTVTGAGSNLPYGNSFSKPDSSCSTNGSTNLGQEHIYAVTPHASGTLRVTVTSDSGVNHMIFARRTCTDAASQGAGMCANNQGASSANTTETMSFSVTKDQMVYVAVDGGGVTANKGNYSINFVIQ